MFAWLRQLVLYRILGGRIMLGLALLRLARRLLGTRRRPAAGADPRLSTWGARPDPAGTIEDVERGA
jgi:hypothetical protein